MSWYVYVSSSIVCPRILHCFISSDYVSSYTILLLYLVSLYYAAVYGGTHMRLAYALLRALKQSLHRALIERMAPGCCCCRRLHDWVVRVGQIEKGLIYSFPVTCEPGGTYKIVQSLPVDGFSRKMMDETMKELIEERDGAAAFLNKDADALARSKL